MTIRTSPNMFLPAIPVTIQDMELRRYLEDLHRALQTLSEAVHRDLSQGESTLTGFTEAPTTASVDTGQVVARTDAGNEALYVNVNGTMMSVGLS